MAPQVARLEALIAEQPDRPLAELRDELGTTASLTTIWRMVGRLGFTVKKTVRATEHDRADVAAARQQWRTTAPRFDPTRLVFLDESGIATDLIRRYGRSRRGTRLPDQAPHGRWQSHTFVAAVRLEGITAPGVIDGPIDGV